MTKRNNTYLTTSNIPSQYHHINSLKKLEELFGISYEIPEREELEAEIFKHPLRFTDYLLKQMKASPAIAKQYLPSALELNKSGMKRPMTGIINTGVPGLERLYRDRVILMPSSQCFAYCRFCFRKDYSHDVRDGDYGSPQDNFEKALNYIREDDRIKEVLITGGDPLMFPEKVIELCKKLQKIPHLTGIRIGTRIFTSDPSLIDEHWIKPFKELNNKEKKEQGNKEATKQEDHSSFPRYLVPISLSPHINHPDELSPETIKSLLLCTQNNIPLYNQTVLLKGINNDADTLIELCRKIRQLGVETYRIYLADPLEGTNHFRCSLEEFLDIKRQMRAKASGRIVPSFIIDTKVGKGEYGSDLEVIKREAGLTEHSEYLWFKTPYRAQDYRDIQPSWKMPEESYEDENGFLVVRYENVTKQAKKAQTKEPFPILQEGL